MDQQIAPGAAAGHASGATGGAGARRLSCWRPAPAARRRGAPQASSGQHALAPATTAQRAPACSVLAADRARPQARQQRRQEVAAPPRRRAAARGRACAHTCDLFARAQPHTPTARARRRHARPAAGRRASRRQVAPAVRRCDSFLCQHRRRAAAAAAEQQPPTRARRGRGRAPGAPDAQHRPGVLPAAGYSPVAHPAGVHATSLLLPLAS